MSTVEHRYDCFNEAALRLPEGWSIGVTIEKGYAGLALTDESGEVVECDRIETEPFPDYVRRAATIAENRHRRAGAK